MLLLLLLLSGCTTGTGSRVDQSYLQAIQPETVAELSGGALLRQSFAPSYNGLSYVTVLLTTPTEVQLLVRVR
ncbi:MAG: hypothetical protein H0T73_18930, partial [Ardenticatenales bacterium]|nr:hypothetical protein [Ardenticatenales bacterium]